MCREGKSTCFNQAQSCRSRWSKSRLPSFVTCRFVCFSPCTGNRVWCVGEIASILCWGCISYIGTSTVLWYRYFAVACFWFLQQIICFLLSNGHESIETGHDDVKCGKYIIALYTPHTDEHIVSFVPFISTYSRLKLWSDILMTTDDIKLNDVNHKHACSCKNINFIFKIPNKILS